jgi:hypothetical protein
MKYKWLCAVTDFRLDHSTPACQHSKVRDLAQASAEAWMKTYLQSGPPLGTGFGDISARKDANRLPCEAIL